MIGPFGYCTNIHAGDDFPAVRSNLLRYATAVREQLEWPGPMGVGLWLSNQATTEILDGQHVPEFGEWLAESSLLPFTLNVFPFHNFHEPVVKHRVYEPSWAERSRLEYTIRSARLLDGLLPANMPGTLSTLPLGWPPNADHEAFLERCAIHLRNCADALFDLEQTTGRWLQVCLEPEPGCCLQYSRDVVEFFHQYLLRVPGAQADRIRRHIGVCHDICHAAVMFEPQQEALQTYQSAGIGIGKIQVSSAVETRLQNISVKEKGGLLDTLEQFVEPRYLHQTVSASRDGETTFFEDLPLAIGRARKDLELLNSAAIWRTHFHVPIYLSACSSTLNTTQQEIYECLKWVEQTSVEPVWEIETYAWNVSPDSVKRRTMVDSITEELQWFAAASQDHLNT